MSVEITLTLDQAADRLGLTRAALLGHIKRGTIRAIQTPGGEMVVSKSDAPDIRKQFEHLRGKAITVSSSTEKYDVPRTTVFEWINIKYVAVLKYGYRMEIDEADVATCAYIYHEHKKNGIKAPLFDEAGRPYQLKHPGLHNYRRKRKSA